PPPSRGRSEKAAALSANRSSGFSMTTRSPRGTSLGRQGRFSLAHGLRRVAERLTDILALEIGMSREDLRFGHAVRQHSHHARDRNAQAADARHAPICLRLIVIRVNFMVRLDGSRSLNMRVCKRAIPPRELTI